MIADYIAILIKVLCCFSIGVCCLWIEDRRK